MRYEYSEAAAFIVLLGAAASIGIWILGLFYGENLISTSWLVVVGGVLYFVHRAITDHIEGMKREDKRRTTKLGED
jgi:4-hydroxybenzoate polyprenyltransferase